jgi:ASC-1-like (ASCH) protein
MVKKQVFVWIVTGLRTIEVREGKAKKGDDAVFQCGKKVLRGKITKKEEGSLTDILRQDNYKNIVPIVNSFEEAIIYLKGLYRSDEGTFTAYYFDLKR